MNDSIKLDIAQLEALIGRDLKPSSWESFDQNTIDCFAALTGETLPIHTAPDSPEAHRFGGTIVQATLLISRLGTWVREVGVWISGPITPLNYGYDKIRILAPVRVGTSVRGRFRLTTLDWRRPNFLLLKLDASVEVRDQDRPAIVADWIIGFEIHPLTSKDCSPP
jgi:acyl dehydratase